MLVVRLVNGNDIFLLGKSVRSRMIKITNDHLKSLESLLIACTIC